MIVPAGKKRILFWIVLFVFVFAAPTLAELPDLTITDISLDQDCRILVTIQNLGPGSLPASANVQGSMPIMALDIDGIQKISGAPSDPTFSLQNSGGVLVRHMAASTFILGQHVLTARIDTLNVLNETNENNNQLTRTLTGNCTQMLPDLALTQIRFLPDCRAVLELRNVGTSELNGGTYVSGARVLRTIDGVSKGFIGLIYMDPGRVLENPGGILTWTEFPEFIGQTSVQYQIDNVQDEVNTANNTLTKLNCGKSTLQKLAPAISRPTRRISPKALSSPSVQSAPVAPTVPTNPGKLQAPTLAVPLKVPVLPPQPLAPKTLSK